MYNTIVAHSTMYYVICMSNISQRSAVHVHDPTGNPAIKNDSHLLNQDAGGSGSTPIAVKGPRAWQPFKI